MTSPIAEGLGEGGFCLEVRTIQEYSPEAIETISNKKKQVYKSRNFVHAGVIMLARRCALVRRLLSLEFQSPAFKVNHEFTQTSIPK